MKEHDYGQPKSKLHTSYSNKLTSSCNINPHKSSSSEDEFCECFESDGDEVDSNRRRESNVTNMFDMFKDIYTKEKEIDNCLRVLVGKESKYANVEPFRENEMSTFNVNISTQDINKEELVERKTGDNVVFKPMHLLGNVTNLHDATIETKLVKHSGEESVNKMTESCETLTSKEVLNEEISASSVSVLTQAPAHGDAIDKNCHRAGKYHKRAAPAPPGGTSQSQIKKQAENKDFPAIKATLVLKPGVIKTLDTRGADTKSEIFCHSPKFKRRLFNTSPSRSPQIRKKSVSPGASKSKLDVSFSKLMTLPRRIGLWNRDDSDIEVKKRSSWYDSRSSGYELTREHSRSDDDLSRTSKRPGNVPRVKLFKEESLD